MQIISKPPTDTFTLSLMTDLIGDRHAYYVWSLHLRQLPVQFPAGQIILCIKDMLSDSDYAGLQLLPSDKFIVCTSLENLELGNMRIVRMGGDWLNQIEAYQRMPPVTDKNFESPHHVISLNRNIRHHRTTVASYLKGTAAPARVTFLNKNTQDFLSAVPWALGELSQDQVNALVTGYLQLESADADIYKDIGLVNNIANFEKNLRPMYRDSLVEVVSETTFNGPFLLTEKTMHCFMAFNFPIILSSCGTVQFLRDVGFDMFDDVVDHSYDKIEDSALRVVTAIDSNYRLMHNGDLAKQKWQECQSRFEKNWEFISSGKLAQWYADRTRKEFSAALVG